MLPPLRLRKNEERRLRAGHLWVFSNEVDVAATPLASFQPGDAVEVQDSRGAPIGAGYVNPRSLICARLISRDARRPLSAGLLEHRLSRALKLREMLFGGEPYYRLVFGEADGLPGLVVDRYGSILVAQVTTAGMERHRDDLVAALAALPGITGVQLRNDTGSRELEGLESYVETAHGAVPDRVEIVENETRFSVPISGGQKTGWFYDHRPNRARLRRYAPGRRVLDLFSYIGGWGVQAATAGAREVVCVDSSASALDELDRSAALNGVDQKMRSQRGDAFDVLARLREEKERFDIVVIDPPAFIKRRKDQKQGEKAYQKINRLAMELLVPDGILFSASCSHHLSRDALLLAMLRAGREIGRDLQILEQGHQGPDHPIHPAIPETEYLKAFTARVS
jgi:23S rRNA (cytosine1962-C5)-methyltransferase